jgi:hypothetical protein
MRRLVLWMGVSLDGLVARPGRYGPVAGACGPRIARSRSAGSGGSAMPARTSWGVHERRSCGRDERDEGALGSSGSS